jgi:hypothetical protein
VLAYGKDFTRPNTRIEAMPFETFRSRDLVKAIYFDGSLDAALEIAKAFPSRVQVEFTGGEDFLLRVNNQASFISAHTYVYENDSGRLEWRDLEELTKRWEQTSAPAAKPQKGKTDDKGQGKKSK